ncbi:uncharacterized protein LOC123518346 isoform X2 [Portunus trituberculatus]|uniref:uncharacterized protein LOC123518346 isoform X2 n=1 Tax=Portunus trituberculatus TaxID=210409 RepID=UPI001E1D169D|nr:uncharacterized protein LOC123518346 isoform X2 [Portunus trituberculatus]
MAPRLLTSTLLLLVCAGTGTHGYLCDDALTNCLGVGYYNKCHDFCDTQYFTCEEIGGPGVLSTCPYGLVFNTDPAGSNKDVWRWSGVQSHSLAPRLYPRGPVPLY